MGIFDIQSWRTSKGLCGGPAWTFTPKIAMIGVGVFELVLGIRKCGQTDGQTDRRTNGLRVMTVLLKPVGLKGKN